MPDTCKNCDGDGCSQCWNSGINPNYRPPYKAKPKPQPLTYKYFVSFALNCKQYNHMDTRFSNKIINLNYSLDTSDGIEKFTKALTDSYMYSDFIPVLMHWKLLEN